VIELTSNSRIARSDVSEAGARRMPAMEVEAGTADLVDGPTVFDCHDVAVHYGRAQALSGVNLAIRRNEITALIGPSGCGKSTFLRCLNRMNDLIPGARVSGDIWFHGEDMYASDVDAVDVRRRIGMVFQKPNPFPKTIRENLAFGMKVNGIRATDERLEQGSSMRMTSGSIARQRAMHRRCCWPPDIPKAFVFRRSLTSSHSAARRRARSTISSMSPFMPSTRGPNAMFS
jgi:ABC-type sugar transport system ATPase subunit